MAADSSTVTEFLMVERLLRWLAVSGKRNPDSTAIAIVRVEVKVEMQDEDKS